MHACMHALLTDCTKAFKQRRKKSKEKSKEKQRGKRRNSMKTWSRLEPAGCRRTGGHLRAKLIWPSAEKIGSRGHCFRYSVSLAEQRARGGGHCTNAHLTLSSTQNILQHRCTVLPHRYTCAVLAQPGCTPRCSWRRTEGGLVTAPL